MHQLGIQAFEFGKDPISLRDKMIEERDRVIADKIREIQTLVAAQENEFVPKVTKEKLEENYKILEAKYTQYADQNKSLESELDELTQKCKGLETALSEKAVQYQFLVAEYRFFEID